MSTPKNNNKNDKCSKSVLKFKNFRIETKLRSFYYSAAMSLEAALLSLHRIVAATVSLRCALSLRCCRCAVVAALLSLRCCHCAALSLETARLSLRRVVAAPFSLRCCRFAVAVCCRCAALSLRRVVAAPLSRRCTSPNHHDRFGAGGPKKMGSSSSDDANTTLLLLF
jgi:hypothetical protein